MLARRAELSALRSGPPALELHWAFVGASGEWRVGPVVPEFEALYEQLTRETFKMKFAQVAERIDRFVYDDALAVFLCEPQALYAANRQAFTPYRTTFELAQWPVTEEHWSRRREDSPR